MAVKKVQVTMQMPSGAQVTEVTLSPQSLCHYIRDDELDKLGEMRKDLVMEICLASVGVFSDRSRPQLTVSNALEQLAIQQHLLI